MFHESGAAKSPDALLIDGDNISPSHADRILDLSPAPGVARVYTDAGKPSGWHAVPQLEIIHAGQGKNAADILLALDALELALTHGQTAFTLVTSDGDFTHLARRLRARGCSVTGVGEAKAPVTFRAACTRFRELAQSAPPSGQKALTLDQRIRAMIAKHSRAGRGMPVSLLSVEMKRAYDFKISGQPERTWRAYLSARPHLFELDPRGPEAHVRFLPAGFDTAIE